MDQWLKKSIYEIWHITTLFPQISAIAITLGPKWWQFTNSFVKRNCMQPASGKHNVLLFFFLSSWGWGGGGFFAFSLVPNNVFLSNFQWVPITFSICSPCSCYVLQHVPNSTSNFLFHMFWQMLSSSQLHRWAEVKKHDPSTLGTIACVVHPY